MNRAIRGPALLPKIPPRNDFRIGPGVFGVADSTCDEETGTGVPHEVRPGGFRRGRFKIMLEDFVEAGWESEVG